MKVRWQWLLGLAGAVVLVYSMTVLGFVATTPDLGIRCLMTDEPWKDGESRGVVIQSVPAINRETIRGPFPKVGDRLIRVGDWTVNSFVDFTRVLMRLRNQQATPGFDHLPDSADPSEYKRGFRPHLGSLLSYSSGPRRVEIEFIAHDGPPNATETCYLDIQSLPVAEVLFSLFW